MSYYPTPSGARFAYDSDGTRVFRTTSAHTVVEMPKDLLPLMQQGDSALAWFPDRSQMNKLTLLFPEPRDVTGVFLACSMNRTGSPVASYTVGSDADPSTADRDVPVRCETSTDTTDGINGAWSQTSFKGGNPRAVWTPSGTTYGYMFFGLPLRRHALPGESFINTGVLCSRAYMTYRTGSAEAYNDPGSGPAPLASASMGIRALRIWLESYNSRTGESSAQDTVYLQMLHVYGQLSSGVSTGQLVAWHPTLDRALVLSDTDQGDVALGSSALLTFRVKNVSPSGVALSPSVFVDVPLVRTNPSLHSYLDLSLDGTQFTQSQSLADLMPGQVSPIITVRRQTPLDAALGVSSFRIGISAEGWEE